VCAVLSGDEERLLTAIERQLRAEDPELDRQLGHGLGSPTGSRRWLLPVLVGLAVLCILVGLLAATAAVFLGGLALAGAAWVVVHRRRRDRGT
jgi:Flp pilus assembly protein TadB